jgi:hypothetical protein
MSAPARECDSDTTDLGAFAVCQAHNLRTTFAVLTPRLDSGLFPRRDLVFGWLDFPLPELGLRYQEPQKLGLLPGRTMSARTVVIRSEDARWL